MTAAPRETVPTREQAEQPFVAKQDPSQEAEPEDERYGMMPYDGEVPLCQAINAGDLQKVQELIQKRKGTGVCILSDGEGSWCKHSALTFAIELNQLAIVKELIKAGADVEKEITCQRDFAGESQEEYRLSPLYIAIARNYFTTGGKKEIAEELIKAGADVNAKVEWHDNWLTPLEATGDVEVAQMLLKYNAEDSLVAALRRNDLNKFRDLLQTVDEGKEEALIKTVRRNEVSLVRELIEAGANVNTAFTTNNPGGTYCTEQTPLSLALEKGYTQIATLLQSHGAKELMCPALASRDVPRIKQAIQAGADLNQEFRFCAFFDCFATTPLGFATLMVKNEEVIELLKSAGAKE